MTKARDILNYIIILCLFLASAVVLILSSFTTIYYDMGSGEDWPHYGKENIPLLILFTLLVFGIFYFLYRKNIFENYRKFWVIGLLFITAYALMLILSIIPQAVNDSKTLDNIINQFVHGDYSALTEPGGYLFTWPFQLGYVAFGQLMVGLFGESNYFAWDMVQLFSALVTVYLIYRITWEIFEERTVCGIVGLLSLGALFFYNYITYIYGDILSMAPQTLALYMMILYVKREKWQYGLVSAISIAVAILIKTNCEITLIALLMVLLGSAITKEDEKKETEKSSYRLSQKLIPRLVIAALMLILVFASKAAVNAYFCKLTGIDKIPDGNPAWAHIAMGLQESPLEDGWYNGYNYKVFAENNYDTEVTAIAAKENIRQTLLDFVNRPLHGGKFFVRKFCTQWADSVCISTHNLDLVSRHVENQPWLCDFLVFGTGSQILIWVMNVFMTVCYIGLVVCFFVMLKRNKVTAAQMQLLILIFGGILFHEFWEGSSRYTMRYYIYYLPYAAYGLRHVFDLIGEKMTKRGRRGYTD